jgi:DedD protein
MASRSEAPDPAVDELRRKARRRLVGAVVLALAAAVALPLLLENEPKPLGDDVSIQIPPVDSGKFVNPLSPAAPDAKAKEDKLPPPAANVPTPAAPAPADAGAKSDAAKTEPAKSESGKSEPGKGESDKSESVNAEPVKREPSTGGARENAAPATPPKTSEGETAAPQVAAVAPSENRAEGKAPFSEAKSGAARPQGGFVVQVAAFSDRYGARSLVAKLKKGGFPGYTETVETDKGTMHRVRVGPYPSREVADQARAKLKAAGYSGVVARSG